MKRRSAPLAALLLPFALAATPGYLVAQVTAIPTASGAEVASTAAAAAPPPTGLLGLFSAFDAKCESCKLNCCHTPFGQLITNAARPMSMMTGGIIPVPCANANAGAAGPAGTASKIQADAAGAKARAAAVRYLGTVDCHYYPEAEASLIASLRADRSECVRLAAAQALANGCCCTKRTIEALTITVEGSEKDGNPSETSMRVKVAAYLALQKCVDPYSGLSPLPPVQPIRPEMPPPEPHQAQAPGTASPRVERVNYYQNVQDRPMSDVIWQAQRALATSRPQLPPAEAQPPRVRRNLLDLWVSSREPAAPDPAARSLDAAPTPAISYADFSPLDAGGPAPASYEPYPTLPTVASPPDQFLPTQPQYFAPAGN